MRAAGRNKIVALAKAMGLRTPLPDTPSLPIGADEVTVLDHTGAFASLPQWRHGGDAACRARSALRHRRTRSGAPTAICRSRVRVMPAQVAADMNMMLNKAVEEGTGRRTMIPGVKTSGKTGTTNAYRDAWFNGYSGNMTSAIWVGNDDYAPTNRMTGGSLPGMIWQQIMAYAHQGIEIKPYPGVAPYTTPQQPLAVSETTKAADYVPPPNLLTRKGADILVRVEKHVRRGRPRRCRRAGRDRNVMAPTVAPSPAENAVASAAASSDRSGPRSVL